MTHLLLLTAACILITNVYGLFRDLEVPDVSIEHVHFKVKGVRPSFEDSIRLSERQADEGDLEYAIRVNQIIAARIIHIHWLRFSPSRFHQRVPLWENYLLWSLGLLPFLPQFKRYHFINYKKSMKRGVGVCGDKSIALAQILSREKLEPVIYANRGHVVIECELSGETYVFDPDYGLCLKLPVGSLTDHWMDVSAAYAEAGARPGNVADLKKIYESGLTRWGRVADFSKLRFYAEPVMYMAKWILPILMIAGVAFVECAHRDTSCSLVNLRSLAISILN